MHVRKNENIITVIFVWVCSFMCAFACVWRMCMEVVLWSEYVYEKNSLTKIHIRCFGKSNCFENGEAEIFGLKYENRMIFLYCHECDKTRIYTHQTQCDLCAFCSPITNIFDVKYLHFVCLHYIQCSHKYNSLTSINKKYIYIHSKKKQTHCIVKYSFELW